MTAKESKAVAFIDPAYPGNGGIYGKSTSPVTTCNNGDWAPLIPESALQAAEAERDRLTSCLSQANILIEQFERDWYMACDERDRRLAERDSLEAELGELRRRVGELRTKYEVRRDNWKKQASTSEWHNGHYMQARDIEADLQLLATDGGADGDDDGGES